MAKHKEQPECPHCGTQVTLDNNSGGRCDTCGYPVAHLLKELYGNKRVDHMDVRPGDYIRGA